MEVSTKVTHGHGQAAAAAVLTPDHTGWADQNVRIAGPTSVI